MTGRARRRRRAVELALAVYSEMRSGNAAEMAEAGSFWEPDDAFLHLPAFARASLINKLVADLRRKRLLVCAWNAETRRKQPPFGREAAECDRGPQKVGLSCGEWFQTRC